MGPTDESVSKILLLFSAFILLFFSLTIDLLLSIVMFCRRNDVWRLKKTLSILFGYLTRKLLKDNFVLCFLTFWIPYTILTELGVHISNGRKVKVKMH